MDIKEQKRDALIDYFIMNEYVAYHEVGHCMLAYKCDVWIDHVSMGTDENKPQTAIRFLPLMGVPKNILISVGGKVAENICYKYMKKSGYDLNCTESSCIEDYENIKKLYQFILSSGSTQLKDKFTYNILWDILRGKISFAWVENGGIMFDENNNIFYLGYPPFPKRDIENPFDNKKVDLNNKEDLEHFYKLVLEFYESVAKHYLIENENKLHVLAEILLDENYLDGDMVYNILNTD